MKTQKKFLMMIAAILLVCLCFGIFALAIDTPNVQVRLDGLVWANSKTVAGTHKLFAGDTYPSSTKPLNFIAQKSSGNKFTADTIVVGTPLQNQTVFFDNQLTSFTQTSVLWRLQLRSPDMFGGCYGYGWMWYDM